MTNPTALLAHDASAFQGTKNPSLGTWTALTTSTATRALLNGRPCAGIQ